MCSTSQECSTRRGTVPVEGIDHPSGGGPPAGPDTEVRAGHTTLRAGSAALQIKKLPTMPLVKSQSLTIREVVERSRCSSRSPCLRNLVIPHTWRAIWLISLEMMSAREKKNSLPWKRVGAHGRRGLSNVGQSPPLNNYILTHQHMSLTPMGDHLPQLLWSHSQLYRWMSQMQ